MGPKSGTIVIYRFQERCIFSTPAQTANYTEAITFVKGHFKNGLRNVVADRIAFVIRAEMSDGSYVGVQISPWVWAEVVNSLAPYEIINIVVKPEPA